MTPDTFITALRQRFAIETARRHRQGEARSQCSSAAGGTSSSMRTSRTRQPAPGRDTTAQDAVLAPLLGIGDVRTDKRIDFVGAQSALELESRVRSGAAAVAFSLYPVDVQRFDGHYRCRRHHAAEIDLVRTQAARRSVVAFGLTPLRSEVETRDRRLIELSCRQRRVAISPRARGASRSSNRAGAAGSRRAPGVGNIGDGDQSPVQSIRKSAGKSHRGNSRTGGRAFQLPDPVSAGRGEPSVSMVPMNFLRAGTTADYVDTGTWAVKAIEEAKRVGSVNDRLDQG